jgi:hypothetical protein
MQCPFGCGDWSPKLMSGAIEHNIVGHMAVCSKRPKDWARRGHQGWRRVHAGLLALHIEKSAGYGTGSDPFANFTAIGALTGQPRYVYPVHRAIEKLTRCLSLMAQGREDELGEEFTDVASLLICAEAQRIEDAPLANTV